MDSNLLSDENKQYDKSFHWELLGIIINLKQKKNNKLAFIQSFNYLLKCP